MLFSGGNLNHLPARHRKSSSILSSENHNINANIAKEVDINNLNNADILPSPTPPDVNNKVNLDHTLLNAFDSKHLHNGTHNYLDSLQTDNNMSRIDNIGTIHNMQSESTTELKSTGKLTSIMPLT